MGMRRLLLAFALISPPTAAIGQNGVARPRVVLEVRIRDAMRGDSAAAPNAIRDGLQRDSLVEVLGQRPIRGQRLRGARYYAIAVFRPARHAQTVEIHAFDVETGRVVVRDSVTFVPAQLAESLAAVGRRVAQAVAADRP
jgi:hypothetical protein